MSKVKAVVVYNSHPEALKAVQAELKKHKLNLSNVALISGPFTAIKMAENLEYDGDLINTLITMVLNAMERYQISQRHVFIVCHYLYDEAPAGEIAGGLISRDDTVKLDFVYPDGSATLRSYRMSDAEIRRIYEEECKFGVRITNALKRADVTPDELAIMSKGDILAIPDIGEKSLPTILAAQEHLRRK